MTAKGQYYSNSREVAEQFGKRHNDVLRAIRNHIKKNGSLEERHFWLSSYETPGTSPQPCFEMDRYGYRLLTNAFTGSRANMIKQQLGTFRDESAPQLSGGATTPVWLAIRP